MSASFSADGRLLATLSGDGVRFWDLATARQIEFMPLRSGRSVILHPDGQTFLTAGGSGLQRWPIQRKEEDHEMRLLIGPPEELGRVQKFGSAALSSDGQKIAVGQFRGKGAEIMDLRQPANQTLFLNHRDGCQVGFSPDGQWIATSTWQGTGAKVWDALTGKLERELPVEGTARVAFSPDGRWLVSSADEGHRFWEIGSWKSHHALVRESARKGGGPMSFTADGKILAICPSNLGVQLVEPGTGQELATLDAENQFPLCFSPDGSQLVTADTSTTFYLWDLRLIRQQLAAMKLDWESTPCPPVPPLKSIPLTIQVLHQTNFGKLDLR